MPRTKTLDYEVISPPVTGPHDDPRQQAYVPVSILEVDPNVQRSTTQDRLDKLAAGSKAKDGSAVDWALMEGITVTVRPNKSLVVTEGQNRVLLVQREMPDAHLWVILNPGENNEAAIALAIAKSRKPHTPYDKWQLNLHDGTLLQVRAEEVLSELGLRLYMGSNSHSADTIGAVGAVERVMKSGGPDAQGIELGAAILHKTLSVLIAAFPGEPSRNDASLITSVGRLIARNDNLKLQRLTTKLMLMPATKWVGKGLDRLPSESKSYAVGKAIIDAYNKQLAEDNEIRW